MFLLMIPGEISALMNKLTINSTPCSIIRLQKSHDNILSAKNARCNCLPVLLRLNANTADAEHFMAI